MKKTILLLVSFLLFVTAFTQTYKEKIESQFLEYTGYISKKDFKKSVEYLNPNFFTVIPKEELVQLMDKAYNNPEFEYAIENPKVMEMADKIVVDNESFVGIKYSNTLKMRFRDTTLDNKTIGSALKGQFGAENVKYDESKNTFEIYSVKKAVANSKDENRWTFVVVEERQKAILEKFIPKELL